MLTFDQLRTVQVIARTGSFSRAGRELFLSQPAISQRVREIERLLGTELFERMRGRQGGLQLTAAGLRVINFAVETLEAYDRLCLDVTGTPTKVPVKVIIGVPGPITASRLVKVLAGAPGTFREIGMEFARLSYVEVVDALRTGRADYGVVVEEPEAAADLCAVRLWHDTWVLAVPESEKDDFDYSSGLIASAIPSRGTHARRIIDSSMRAEGLQLVPTVEAPFVETLVEVLVSAGVPAFVPASAIAEHLAAGVVCEVSLPGTPIDVSAWLLYHATRDDMSLTTIFLELLRSSSPSFWYVDYED